MRTSIKLTSIALAILFLVPAAMLAQRGGPPANTPGADHMIIVTPGSEPNSLSFTYSGCTSNCSERPVVASGRGRRNTVSWRFTFSGERVVLAQVIFPGGTPFFQERANRARGARKFYDDHSTSDRGGALGLASIQKQLKTLNWQTSEGLSEIEDGDEFKYDVLVITEKDGKTNVYVADPIVIIRGAEDRGGA